MKKKSSSGNKLESVKLHQTVMKLVREHKTQTMIPIGSFIEKAIQEKLEREFVKSKGQ